MATDAILIFNSDGDYIDVVISDDGSIIINDCDLIN